MKELTSYKENPFPWNDSASWAQYWAETTLALQHSPFNPTSERLLFPTVTAILEAMSWAGLC